MKYILPFCLAVYTLCACNENSHHPTEQEKTNPKYIKKADSLSGIWNLFKINDTLFDITEVYGYETDQPNLKIEVSKKLISGYSGCNSYGGEVIIDKARIKLTEGIMATEIGCGSNIWENDYFFRLGDIQSYEFGTDTLKIFNSDNKSMTFLRRHLHELELNRWELMKVNDTVVDIQKVYDSPNVSQPVLNFNFQKNQINGWNGCHSFELKIDFHQDHFTSGKLLSDARGCYEGWLEKFYGILADNKYYKIDGNKLLLTNSNGNTLEFKISEY